MLNDLALVFVALAHGTDHHLDHNELKVIAERLVAWQPHFDREAVLEAVGTALNRYEMREDLTDSLGNAIAHIRDKVPEARRASLLNDLIEVAWADNKFIHEESSLIGQLAHAWHLHPTSDLPNAGRMWNVIDQRSSADAWTPVHDLALVYLMLAREPDDELAPVEVVAITQKLGEWLPNALGDDVTTVVLAALKVYASGPTDTTVQRAIAAIKAHVPPHQRQALLNDLTYIANADRVMKVEEKALIAQLAAAWEV